MPTDIVENLSTIDIRNIQPLSKIWRIYNSSALAYII